MMNYFHVSPITGVPSGVIGYDYEGDNITVYFKGNAVYNYSHESCGEDHVNAMKNLADGQRGLNTYVTHNKPPYAWKR